MKERASLNRRKYRKLAIVYGIFVIVITLCRKPQAITKGKLYWDYIERNIQLVPLQSLQELVKIIFDNTFSINARVLSAINVIGNIFIMTPLGFLLPCASKKMERTRCFLFFMIGSILLIEIIQVFGTVGSFDIDDIILNLVGSVLGLCVFKHMNGRQKK